MSMFTSPTEPADLAAVNSLATLVDLHLLCVDTLQGFHKMSEKAETEFRPVVERFCALHARHAARLDVMVREMGGVPDADGSFMGTVNRAVISLRAVFDAIDTDVMHSVRAGEAKVLAAFDTALQASLPQGHLNALAQMQAELSAVLDDTRSLG